MQSGPITPEKWRLVDVVVRFSLIKESFFFFFTDHQGCFSEISTERSQKKMPLRRVECVPLLMTSVDEELFKKWCQDIQVIELWDTPGILVIRFFGPLDSLITGIRWKS